MTRHEQWTILSFHLEGIETGRQVNVFNIDPGNDERLWTRMDGHWMLNQIDLAPGSIVMKWLA